MQLAAQPVKITDAVIRTRLPRYFAALGLEIADGRGKMIAEVLRRVVRTVARFDDCRQTPKCVVLKQRGLTIRVGENGHDTQAKIIIRLHGQIQAINRFLDRQGMEYRVIINAAAIVVGIGDFDDIAITVIIVTDGWDETHTIRRTLVPDQAPVVIIKQPLQADETAGQVGFADFARTIHNPFNQVILVLRSGQYLVFACGFISAVNQPVVKLADKITVIVLFPFLEQSFWAIAEFVKLRGRFRSKRIRHGLPVGSFEQSPRRQIMGGGFKHALQWIEAAGFGQ